MKNKGFTLIELLAVIVILAIIALIATPTILGVVENARRGAAESTVLGYVDAIEKQVMINEMDSDTTNDFANADYTIEQLDAKKVSVKGQKPSLSGTNKISIKDGEVQDTTFTVGKYTVKYTKSTGKAVAQ